MTHRDLSAHRRCWAAIGMLVILFVESLVAGADDTGPTLASSLTPTFRRYCGKCHGAGEDVEGDVNLARLKPSALAGDLHLLRKLIAVLDERAMPPEDARQLSDDERNRALSTLRTLVARAEPNATKYQPTPVRRMNRFQYNNAVMDLFDLKCIVFTLPERMMREHNNYFQPATGKMPEVVTVGSRPLGKSQMIERRLGGVAAFPQDLRAEHGFDNQADHLSLSPLLLESFLNLGQSITQSPDFVPRNVGIWQSFFAEPSADVEHLTAARERLQPFLRRAFRGPISDRVVERYVGYVDKRLHEGDSFTEAMKAVAAAVLASPRFYYLFERGDDGRGIQQLDDYELATRLSFFLWGSIPDDELLDLAASGELSKPDVLAAQVDRMLKDRKLKRFCDSFPTQWLQLDRIISSTPDPQKFPGFYFSKYRDSMHMMLEPLLLFETVLIENQPITQFIDSDFTYRSPLLEDAYDELATPGVKRGGGAVTVLRFRRVPVKDRRAGGLITNAAVMTMTSGTERTKPITRGAWVAAVILNDPPKPPPANVPPLAEKPTGEEAKLTLRERIVLHRKRADCRGCHEKIDPLGFALENYDPVGRWREKYDNGRDIDVAGMLFGRHRYSTVIEFKDALLAEKDRFTRALAGHLLSFALARELDVVDERALDTITAETAADDYRIQTMIRAVIQSEPFQTKVVEDAE